MTQRCLPERMVARKTAKDSPSFSKKVSMEVGAARSLMDSLARAKLAKGYG